jgi:hypothetical protein
MQGNRRSAIQAIPNSRKVVSTFKSTSTTNLQLTLVLLSQQNAVSRMNANFLNEICTIHYQHYG